MILALEGFQDNTEVEYLADGSWRFVIDGVSRTTQPSAPLEKMGETMNRDHRFRVEIIAVSTRFRINQSPMSKGHLGGNLS